ncbi:MAG: hypothetical protein WDN01_21420 [Rhizomicrobium sp.]
MLEAPMHAAQHAGEHVPSPTPASNIRTAGGRGWMFASSSVTRFAISRFSLHVLTNIRYFWRLS